MFKLCIALAFLAVAAAKPSWPLTYSGLNEFGYPLTGYPYNVGFPAPVVKTIAPVVPAPLVKTVAPIAPIAPIAHVDPFYHGIAPIGYPAGLAYDAGYPFILKKK